MLHPSVYLPTVCQDVEANERLVALLSTGIYAATYFFAVTLISPYLRTKPEILNFNMVLYTCISNTNYVSAAEHFISNIFLRLLHMNRMNSCMTLP